MAWKKVCGLSVYVSHDVSIEEFDAPQLLQGLIDGGLLAENEAERVLNRQKVNFDAREKKDEIGRDFPKEELATAREDLAAGRRVDALIHLERFLGRDWMGVLVAGIA
jgi:hypothetical protein